MLFRSLATLFEVGVSLERSLGLLAAQAEEESLGVALDGARRRILYGQPLSHALSAYPGVFSRFHLYMVKVGESSGSLSAVLAALAQHEEWMHRTRMRLKSALSYPAFLLVACSAMLLVGPPMVLEGQYKLILSSGVEPPLLTKVVMGVSSLLTSWGFWVLAVLVGGLAGWGLKKQWERRSFRLWMTEWAERLPLLGHILKKATSARFARALSLQVNVGVRLSEALPLAAQSSVGPVLEDRIADAVKALMNGSNLTQSLHSIDYFEAGFLGVLEAGEISGKVSQTLDWAARLYEMDLEAALERFTNLLEPLLMLWMGSVVAVLLVATLAPTVKLLETL